MRLKTAQANKGEVREALSILDSVRAWFNERLRWVWRGGTFRDSSRGSVRQSEHKKRDIRVEQGRADWLSLHVKKKRKLHSVIKMCCEVTTPEGKVMFLNNFWREYKSYFLLQLDVSPLIHNSRPSSTLLFLFVRLVCDVLKTNNCSHWLFFFQCLTANCCCSLPIHLSQTPTSVLKLCYSHEAKTEYVRRAKVEGIRLKTNI